MSDKKLRFTTHVQRALEYAQEEADKQNLNDINSEHLLLGLMREESSAAGQFLRELGVGAKEVLEFISREPPFRRNALVGLMVLDTNGTVLFRNPAAQDIIDQHEGTLSKTLDGLSADGEIEITIDDQSYLATSAPESGGRTIVVLQAITHGEKVYKDFAAFAQTMRNELKTPVTVIKLSAQLIERIAPPEGMEQRYVKRIIAAADDLIVMLNKLFEGNDTATTDFEPCDLKAVVDRAVADLQGIADSKAVRVRFDFPTETCVVFGNENMLCHMVVNLLSNAITYSPNDKEVTVELSRSATEIHLSIRDQGPGMSPEEIQHIFKRYVGPKKGYGLGLSIVQAVVERHGGTVNARNNAGGGMEFVVVLPALNQELTVVRT